MDPGIPIRLEELRRQDAAHEGDSTLYINLAIRCFEISRIARRLMRNPGKGDEDTVDALMREETIIHEDLLTQHKITDEQRMRLFLLMALDHEPSVDNNQCVYPHSFPSLDYDPPPRAA